MSDMNYMVQEVCVLNQSTNGSDDCMISAKLENHIARERNKLIGKGQHKHELHQKMKPI